MAVSHHTNHTALPELTRRQLLRLVGGIGLVAGVNSFFPHVGRAQTPDGVLNAFSPPANIDDFPPGPHRKQLHRQWNNIVNQYTEQAIVGNPWTSNFDQDRSFYFNPLTTPIPAKSRVKLIEWIAYPNRITTYLGTPDSRFSPDQLLEFAENGRLADGTTLPTIPSDICPFLSSHPEPTITYQPPGPRGWQDEYCEWAVERAADGEIVRVMFTCENPEYWHTVWNVEPQKVLELYQQLVSPKVKLDDLVLHDAQSKAVRNPNTGQPVYNPLNKWNNSTQLLPDSGGAVHLTSPPNNLGAEIGLGAAATLLRYQDDNPQDLICCTPYGQSFRHSDPHIGFTINQAVRELGTRITITNPVGLYIQTPDFENIELPPDLITAGLTAQDFWHLERGTPGRGLHAVFKAPKGYEKIKLSSLKINGKPLHWGAQIVTTFQIGLTGVLIPAGDTPAQIQLACPNDENPPPNRPAPLQLIDDVSMQAFLAAGTTGVSSTASPEVKSGQVLRNMVLITTGTKADTAIQFLGGGITVKVHRFIEDLKYHVPGNTGGGVFNVFVIDIEVSQDASGGQRALRLGPDSNTPAPAFLTVVGS